jgi:phosphatidylglycerophosphate synthase
MSSPASLSSATAPPRVVSPWNPANAVTASRYLTLPPFLWAVAHEVHQVAAVAIVALALLDKLDGLVAKIFDCKSSFGEFFDAITDGICYGFCLIVAVIYGWAPLWPVVISLTAGGLNSLFRIVYARRARRPVNYKSYAMERLVAFVAYLVGFAVGGYEVGYFFWIFVPLMVVVVAHDAKRMLLDPIPEAPAASAVTGAPAHAMASGAS